MQLRNARLCLDCDEVHDVQQCPRCASETFAFITRWVPAPERRERPRPPSAPVESPSESSAASGEELEAYRTLLDPAKANGSPWRLVRQGAMGLALVGMAGWLWKAGGATRAEKDQQ